MGEVRGRLVRGEQLVGCLRQVKVGGCALFESRAESRQDKSDREHEKESTVGGTYLTDDLPEKV